MIRMAYFLLIMKLMNLENNLKYVLALLAEIEETVLKSLSSQRGSSLKKRLKEISQKDVKGGENREKYER